ncbi:MAG: protein-disulfide reductase DsbD domain-containing protein [Paracoccus sp. (in: a-proteobacteria)]
MKYALILTLRAVLPLTPPAAAGDPSAEPVSAAARKLPQGLVSARFLPGWTDAEGRRIAALELELEPGWKTYWRSPGEAGLPPHFDWQGSNIGQVHFDWPAPEVIESGGLRTLGYHEKLVLPFTITPSKPDQPIGISARVTFGLCEDICVPAELDLIAPPAGDRPDPVIEAALALTPHQGRALPACEIGEIEDGMTLTLTLPEPGAELVVEHGTDPGIWVSSPELSGDGLEASVDFVAPSGKPFPLDPLDVLLTQLGEDGATEYRGCAAG